MEEAYLEGRQSSRGMSIWSLSGSGMMDGMKNPNLCCVELNSDVLSRLFVSWVLLSRRKPNWAFSGPESEIPSRIDGNRWESMALSHRFLPWIFSVSSIDPNRWSPKNFICKAKIKRIHENRGWYYVLCSKCGKKLYPEQEDDKLNFVCKDDDNIIPNFRYCVNATIEDPTGSTGTVFFNESMEAILNVSCGDMVNKHADTTNPKIVPQPIRSVTDTTRLLNFTLKTDGQIVVNNVSDVASTTETQSTSTAPGMSAFTPTTPIPKSTISKRPIIETPGKDKKMKLT
ncbi:hypothetical protein CASFOL_013955 [Castilleja foliolosa]|uniref:Replication factor A C-terminal domain-containing protein n=1 Tax=Castilleja foliolosa TaxID=1961234 RepID=A0ABD3DLH3_9LAMI